jgi:hypothetical protein
MNKKVIIESAPKFKTRHQSLPYSKDTLLVGLTPETAHADELAPVNETEFEV